jgi:hypothetical protein
MNRTTIAPQQPAVAAAARPWTGLGHGYWCATTGMSSMNIEFVNAAATKRTARRLGSLPT